MQQNVIQALGGPTKVARMLGLTKPGSVQRVSNWQKRGVPLKVIVENPTVFASVFAQKPTEEKAAS